MYRDLTKMSNSRVCLLPSNKKQTKKICSLHSPKLIKTNYEKMYSKTLHYNKYSIKIM